MKDRINILIDADSIYFKVCCVTKRKHEIRKYIKQKIREIEGDCSFFFDNVNVMLAIKGKGNYRDRLFENYKGKRPELEQDMKEALAYALEFMENEMGAIPCHDMEADDMVAIWAYECMDHDEPYVIAHIDKDIDQVPGAHYNFNNQNMYDITREDGYKKLMLQCLTGDRTDNIAGIKGIGPKKAALLLEDVHPVDYWKTIENAWAEKQAGDPYLSHKLLRMITSWEEYDYITSSL